MRHIITIMKKELTRVFKDKRLAFMNFIFPALMLYLMYSLMGNFMFSEPEKYIVGVDNIQCMPEDVKQILNQTVPNLEMQELEIGLTEAKESLRNNIYDLIVVFDEDFLNNPTTLTNVMVMYNPTSTSSSTINSLFISALDVYKKTLQVNQFGENFEIFNIHNSLAADEEETMGQMYALILPFLIITFLFSGVTAVAPESIAGEKERGTITTLLVTPVKRTHIALGKISALSILAILSAVSSFVGLMISLPKLMGSSGGAIENMYGISEYIMVLCVLIVTSLVLVSLVSIFSCFAKNVKEASMYTMPLMLISMGISMTSMLGLNADNNLLYMIPIFNSCQLLSEVFTFNVDITHFIITIVTNIVVSGVLIYVLTKMFDNEKIMFSK